MVTGKQEQEKEEMVLLECTTLKKEEVKEAK